MGSFFDKIDALISPTYRPSDEDVLRARLRTTGIEEANFVFDDFAFCMIDVGGAAFFVSNCAYPSFEFVCGPLDNCRWISLCRSASKIYR